MAKSELVFGQYLRQKMDERGVSGHGLARQLGISEGSVRNLLRYGLDDSAPSPYPKTLRALSDYLGENLVQLFEIAGYLPPQTHSHQTLSPQTQALLQQFEALSTRQQQEVIQLMEQLRNQQE